MKIAYVINDLNTGGAQTLIAALIESAPPGHEFHVICLSSRGDLSERLEMTAEVHHLNIKRGSINVIRLVRRVAACLRRVSPDVVHSHLLQSDLAVALASTTMKLRIVSTVHSTGFSSADSMQSRVLGPIVARFAARFQAVVACGPGARQFMADLGYVGSNASVIDNGVPIAQTIATPDRSLSEVLCLSRWHPMKDHATLISAFSHVIQQFPSGRLRLAGTGITDSNEKLVELIESAGLSEYVQLLGPTADVPSLISTSVCTVISSAWGEALPMAGLESIARGIPVVTTDVGDCRRLVISDEFCVPTAESVSLAGAIIRVLTASPSDYAELQTKSYAHAQAEFSIVRTSQLYFSIYKMALHREQVR